MDATYRAQLTFPPGLDETRLAVFDGDVLAAETTWRASDNYRPGPANWDWQLNMLSYARTTRREPDGGGFGCNCRAIFRYDEGGEA